MSLRRRDVATARTRDYTVRAGRPLSPTFIEEPIVPSLWQEAARRQLLDRLRGWGVLAYRHIDHHFRQFGA